MSGFQSRRSKGKKRWRESGPGGIASWSSMRAERLLIAGSGSRSLGRLKVVPLPNPS